MMKKQLDYDMFIKLTSYLSRETDYIAWYSMFKNFEYLSSFLPFEESYSLKVDIASILCRINKRHYLFLSFSLFPKNLY